MDYKDYADKWGFGTKAILYGQQPDPTTGAIIQPIYQTSTYVLPAIGESKGYFYSRTGNPTRSTAATTLAALEDGQYGFLYPSGMAAILAVLQQLKPGDHIIACDDLYGGAHRIITQIFEPLGLEYSFINVSKSTNVFDAVKDNTKLVWIETPSNPCMVLCDIKEITTGIKAMNPQILIGCDNTFATPYCQKSLHLGVDIVMHSCTKYLGGHSDILLGALIVNNEQIAEKLSFHQNATGTVAAPFDCWLLMRGMKTLKLRMREHHNNCKAVAQWLDKHPMVKKVNCPILESNPQHTLYKKQMTSYNGMLSFELKSNFNKVKKLCSSTRLIQLAECLGGVESLICHPASMTHAAVPKKRRESLGITDTLIRLSVGIEDLEDIINDLEFAFSNI